MLFVRSNGNGLLFLSFDVLPKLSGSIHCDVIYLVFGSGSVLARVDDGYRWVGLVVPAWYLYFPHFSHTSILHVDAMGVQCSRLSKPTVTGHQLWKRA